MEDKKNYEKQPAKTKELKTPKGKSATGKPLEGILINPQQELIARSANEDFRGLTATSRAFEIAQRQSLARLAERKEENSISELFTDLDHKQTTGLIKVIENVINEYKALGDPMAASLQKMLSDVLPRDMVTESLIKKSNKSGIPFSTLSEVFNRGMEEWDGGNMTCEQYAFARVNSYVARGKAYELDADLRDESNINEALNTAFAQLIKKNKPPKREHGGIDINEAGKETDPKHQKQSGNPNDSSSRYDATKSLVKVYKKSTPDAIKEDLNESFQIAYAAGIGVTLTAKDLGMKVQGAFELHPSVVEEMTEVEEEVRSADVKGEIIPASKKLVTDPKTGQIKYVNVPAHLARGKVRKKIIRSGDVHNGEQE